MPTPDSITFTDLVENEDGSKSLRGTFDDGSAIDVTTGGDAPEGYQTTKYTAVVPGGDALENLLSSRVINNYNMGDIVKEAVEHLSEQADSASFEFEFSDSE